VKRIWAFDHRGGKDLVNEQVTLGQRPKKPAQAGLGEFNRPRIQWRAAESKVTPKAATLPPVPATEAKRLKRFGGCYHVAEQIFGHGDSSLVELAKRYADAG
jgi:hypothetical protein